MNFLSSLLNNIKTLIVSDLQLTSPTVSPYKTEYMFTEEPVVVLATHTLADISQYRPYTMPLLKGGYLNFPEQTSATSAHAWQVSQTSLSSDGLTLTLQTALAYNVAYGVISVGPSLTCDYRIISYH